MVDTTGLYYFMIVLYLFDTAAVSVESSDTGRALGGSQPESVYESLMFCFRPICMVNWSLLYVYCSTVTIVSLMIQECGCPSPSVWP